ncbi:hypothetical protein ACWF9G_04680, partial [Nocardia sp. NPDC055029]
MSWPAWRLEQEPAELCRYVRPDVVARLVERRGDGRLGGLPGPGPAPAIGRAREAFEAIRSCGITYADEPFSPAGQLIRSPEEVLWTPRIGNCLDLSVVYAGALLHAGLHPLVVVLERDRAEHAIVLVWLRGERRGAADADYPLAENAAGLHDRMPAAADDDLRERPDAPGAFLAVDIAVVAGPDGPGDFESAVARGFRLLTDGAWNWRQGIDVGLLFDPQRCHAVEAWPHRDPLHDPYFDPEVHQDPDADTGPLRLLWARYPVVPYSDRNELDVLLDWCQAPDPPELVTDRAPMRVAILHGDGGAGKTRLAAELAHRLRSGGTHWYAGFLPRRMRANSDSWDTGVAWLARTVTPLLVIVDYAESTPSDEVATLLDALANRRGQRTCVLLTARTFSADRGGWWQRVAEGIEGHQYLTMPVRLTAEHPSTTSLFRRAQGAFRDRHPVAAPAALRGDSWTVLETVMLAWLSVHNAAEELPATTIGLYEKIVGHEMRYWRRVYDRRAGKRDEYSLEDAVFRQAAACVTATGPVTERVDTVLKAVRELDGDSGADSRLRARFAAVIRDVLVPDDDGRLHLHPDPLGDYLAATTFDDDLNRDYQGRTGADAEPLLHRCLDRAAPVELANTFITITRAAQDEPGRARCLADAALTDDPARANVAFDIALRVGGPFVEPLERAVGAGDNVLPLEKILSGVPVGHVALGNLARIATERALQLGERSGRSGDAPLAMRAALLNDLAIRQAAGGQREAALESITEATRLYRSLTQANTAAFLPYLAGSLNNLANQQAAVGQREIALDSITEAIRHHRSLAQANPAAFLPDLAGSLNNLANQQAAVGQREAALESITEAVQIRRSLAQTNPAAFLPALAMSLNNLAIHQAEVGQHAAALESITEAVQIRRSLAQTNPAASLPNLAMSLNNLAVQQAKVGQHAAALDSNTEATHLYQSLAQANPAAFLPDLALSLNNLANHQAEVGQREAALESITEAVQIRRSLAQTNPAAFLPDLALSLNNLANRQAEVGQRAAALESITEAIRHHRSLAQANPAAFLPDLAGSLNNLANQQAKVGQHAAALESITAATHLYQSLAQANPAVFLPALAMSLHNLANQQAAVGQHAAALDSITEAVQIRRSLAQTNPAAFLPALAGSLNNLANHQAEAGQHAAALETITEATHLYRSLAQTNPAAFLPDLAGSLNNLANRQAEAGQHAAALDSITEATHFYKSLAQANAAAFLPALAGSLNNLGNHQAEAGQHAAALETITEATRHHRSLVQTNLAAFLPDLAMSLNNLANQQAAVGQHAAALDSITEAVQIRRSLAQTNPAAFLP